MNLQKYSKPQISRRDFLKLSAASLGGMALSPWRRIFTLPDFPQAERLGRVCEGMINLRAEPDHDAQSIGVLYEDSVVPWLQDVVGRWPWRNNQRWVETPDGYIWSPYVQPVKNQPAQPVDSLPQMGEEIGMWVQVCVPCVDAVLDNPPARSHWLRYRQENGMTPRLYYSQVLWIDQIKTDADGQVWYRINERYGSPGDIFWALAEAFRPITREELEPISPDVEDKRIVIDINYNVQSLSCFEGDTEVYYCRISSGRGENSTPLNPSPGFPIWRKLYSIHMAGGTVTGGWDLPGIAWTSLFVSAGVAIHATFWHNNYGEPMSHGCVNIRPEDAKWIFRWTQPSVPFESGDVTISGEGSTRVIVEEW
ncbi:MAG: L,D-transpeptidase family protein [Chloroflexota bacterium]|nr:L,D-transpeptidase family protein [Chloroflexota bacterium]